jgi:AcrR family transcriptional regulator
MAKEDAIKVKDREVTEQKIIEAVGRVICRGGYERVDINAVAKEAGVSRMLIYRYFGDLDGLLSEFARQKDYWLKLNVSFKEQLDRTDFDHLQSFSTELFIGQLRDLRANRELQELIRWSLAEKRPFIQEIDAQREKVGIEIIQSVISKLPSTDLDIKALIGLLISGLYYIVLRSSTTDVFNGIDLSSENGWGEIETGITQFFDLLFKSENFNDR